MKIYIVLFVAAMAMAEDISEEEQILVDGNNQFTAKMYSEVLKHNPDHSVVLSAFSVLSPLAQLAMASVGESHDEINRAIGMPNDNVTKSVFPLVNTKLRSAKGVEFKMANKVFVADGFELNDEFASLSKAVFNSEVKNIDFAKNIETANEINTWVEDNTNHRIKDLVNPDSLDSNTRAVLVNAIYFKGSWKEKFDPTLTKDREFHVSKDKTVEIPTMYRKGDFKYGESSELNAKLLEMNYEGDESSMLIILPNEIDGITALNEKLKDPSAISRATKDMFTVEVEVYLPKFKIETETNLKQVLSEIGVQKLFDSSKARLDNLLKKTTDLYISDAIQKAFIEVNEEGAEAAAANAFFVTFAAPAVRFTKLFDANRPFAFYLKQGKITLFNGVFNSELP